MLELVTLVTFVYSADKGYEMGERKCNCNQLVFQGARGWADDNPCGKWGKGKTFPLPCGNAAAAPNMHWTQHRPSQAWMFPHM